MRLKASLLVLSLIILSLVNISIVSFSSSRLIYYSPSYLLLSNWENQSIWIVTGVKVPNSQLNGFPNYPAGISNIYAGKYGLLNLTLNFNLSTTSAYLTLNNSILLSGNQGNITILLPPYTPYIIVKFYLISTLGVILLTNRSIIYVNNSMILNGSPPVYIFSNISHIMVKKNQMVFILTRGIWFIEIGINNIPKDNINNLILLNNMEVSKWLNSSKIPNHLPRLLVNEYFLSLLILKDDQNPCLGIFAASPSPIYLYSWVRDSIFSAIALQDAGHFKSALKYWLWLSSAEQLQSGVWYTRYYFYNGKPDITFGIPELDSIGLYEIGIYDYYNLTDNMTFLKQVLGTLNKSIEYQINEIYKSKFHLIPPDLSVWEDREAYHFWTEALNDLGLLDVVKIYKMLGFNYSKILYAQQILNLSIMKYFWQNNFFVSALETSVLFKNNESQTILSPEPPSIDSATLLPIDLGYLPPKSNYSIYNFKTVISELTVNGGLSRFSGDLYHYSEYLYDSSGPNPPWVITTLFEALYLEEVGNYNRAIDILSWVYEHSQHGLLPEALDPRYLNPLPTTSPLTWSSAMFIIVSLNYKPQQKEFSSMQALVIIIIMMIIIIIMKKWGRRFKGLV